MSSGRVLTAVLAACFASACSHAQSDGADPEPDPSRVSEVQDDTGHDDGDTPGTPGQVPPALPDQARDASSEGAEAFIRHFVDLRNFAATTGDVDAFQDATQDCSGCDKYADLYRRTYEAGGYIRSTGWEPTSVDVVDQGVDRVALVTVEAPRMSFTYSGDDRKRIGRGGTYKLRFELSANSGGWVVTDFGVQTDASDL